LLYRKFYHKRCVHAIFHYRLPQNRKSRKKKGFAFFHVTLYARWKIITAYHTSGRKETLQKWVSRPIKTEYRSLPDTGDGFLHYAVTGIQREMKLPGKRAKVKQGSTQEHGRTV